MRVMQNCGPMSTSLFRPWLPFSIPTLLGHLPKHGVVDLVGPNRPTLQLAGCRHDAHVDLCIHASRMLTGSKVDSLCEALSIRFLDDPGLTGGSDDSRQAS